MNIQHGMARERSRERLATAALCDPGTYFSKTIFRVCMKEPAFNL